MIFMEHPKIGWVFGGFPWFYPIIRPNLDTSKDSFGNPRPLPQLEVGRVSAKSEDDLWQRFAFFEELGKTRKSKPEVTLSEI